MTEVTRNCRLRIQYTDGGHEDVSEDVLLKIFDRMKKDLTKKRKRGVGKMRCVKRKLSDDMWSFPHRHTLLLFVLCFCNHEFIYMNKNQILGFVLFLY